MEGLLEAGTIKKFDVIAYLQGHAQQGWLQLWHLAGDCKLLSQSRNQRQIVAAYRDFVQSGEHAIVGDEEVIKVVKDEEKEVFDYISKKELFDPPAPFLPSCFQLLF